MNRRKIEIIAAVIILLALIALVIYFLTRHHVVPSGPTETPLTETGVPEVNPADVPPPAAVSAQTISRVFVERFGSYSSESDFQNVADVMALATPSFQQELEGVIADERRSSVTGGAYYGISTYVISSKVTAETDTTTTILTTTQRKESIGSPANTTVRYQDIEVRLEKVGEDWLIDGYTWK